MTDVGVSRAKQCKSQFVSDCKWRFAHKNMPICEHVPWVQTRASGSSERTRTHWPISPRTTCSSGLPDEVDGRRSRRPTLSWRYRRRYRSPSNRSEPRFVPCASPTQRRCRKWGAPLSRWDDIPVRMISKPHIDKTNARLIWIEVFPSVANSPIKTYSFGTFLNNKLTRPISVPIFILRIHVSIVYRLVVFTL